MEIDVLGIMKAIRHSKLLLIGLILLPGGGMGAQNLSDTIDKAWLLCHAEKFIEAATLLEGIADSCLNAHDTLLLPYVHVNSYAQEKIGNHEKCIVYTLKEIELRQKYRIREEKYIFLFERLGNAFEKIGDLDNAEKYYRRGLLKTITLLSDTNELQKWKASDVREYRSLMYRKLGNLYASKGDTALAKACYRSVNEYLTVKWLIEWGTYALKLQKGERYEEAMAEYDKMAMRICQIDSVNEECLMVLLKKGLILTERLNRFDEAILICKQIIDISKDIPYNMETVGFAYCGYVMCEAYWGDFDKIEKKILQIMDYISHAISYAKNRPGETELMPHAVYRYIGDGAVFGKHYAEAIPYYEKYLSYTREKGIHFERTTNNLSVCYIEQGYPLKAKMCLMKILQSETSLFESNHKRLLGDIYHNLGRSNMLLGEYDEAITFLQHSLYLQKEILPEPSAQTIEYLRECQGYIH